MKNIQTANLVTDETLFTLHDITKNVKIPTLLLTTQLLSEIAYCHHKIKNIEWSGTLIYKFDDEEFNIKEFYNKESEEDIIITASSLLLKDIGSAAHTTFDLEAEDIIENGNLLMEGYKMGLIHTH